ncbi:MAG: GGDEF domain-containing protein, partial [Xanthobacteraceae bacterium]
MHLDLQTISVVTAFIVALLGAFLVFAGLQSRNVCAPIWWGSAHIVNACGFALLTARGSAPEFVTICIANALMLFGYGLTWTGARIFDGRPLRPSV